MRTALLVLLLSTGSAAGQTVNLEGAWKWHAGDNPQFAVPQWDDSAWGTETLPRRYQIPTGVAWFRYHGVAPASTRDLALAIGSYSFCGEAFVNGVQVGRIPCQPGQDPPFFSPRVYPLPAGLLEPGKPFVIALRAEHHFALWGNASFLLDEGPYLIADASTAEAAAHAALGRLQRNASAFIVFVWTAIAIGSLLLVLWAANPSRRELLWFALFQLCVSAFSGSQLLLVYGTEASRFVMAWSVPAAWMFLIAAVQAVLFDRELSLPMWCGAAILSFGSRFVLPGFYWQLPVLAVLFIWAAGRLRNRPRTDRLFAVALLLYSIVGSNSAISRTLPGLWPIPGSFSVGPFLIVTISALNALLSSAMLVLLILRLGEDQREKQRLAGELAAAAEMQSLLLPASAADGVEAVYLPAAEVGGDFYQALRHPDGSRLVLVGDVSGKGLRAAMLVSVAIGILRREPSSSPASILRALNDGLVGKMGGGFITCCCARFAADGTVVIANAGHLPPYVDGREPAIEAQLPLGVARAVEYVEEPIAGERFVFVSDGVVEAANAKSELFGFERTREMSGKPAAVIAEAARAWGQNDDITVVTVRRQP
jgi:hypothetical protein